MKIVNNDRVYMRVNARVVAKQCQSQREILYTADRHTGNLDLVPKLGLVPLRLGGWISFNSRIAELAGTQERIT